MRNREAQAFDFEDTLVLKGLAILAIVFHNFYHRIGLVKENELTFDPHRFPVFLAHVIHPTETFQALFSYLGHFGVQVFIFLSAYGLALKYYPLKDSPAAFMWSRVKKIYPMYFLAVLLWAAYLIFARGPAGMAELLSQNAIKLVLTPLALINWVPHLGLPPIGPWWFLPFIIQFYFLWPVFVRFSERFELKGLAALAVVSLVVTSLIEPIVFAKWEINLQLSPFGHVPEICLGIAMARFEYRIGALQATCAAVLFVVGNIYDPVWLITFVTALILSLYLYQAIRPMALRSSIFGWLGGIAMPIFFVNGIVRIPFLEIAARHQDQWFVVLALGLLSASLTVAIAFAFSWVERWRTILGRRPEPLTERIST